MNKNTPYLKTLYVVCRPTGGIADALSQVARCYEYAKRFHRTLIVDSKYSGLQDTFSNYFLAPNATSLLKGGLDPELEETLGSMSIAPGFLACANVATRHKAAVPQLWWLYPKRATNRLEYLAGYDAKQKNYVEPVFRKKITFRFSKAYRQQVLVHHQGGGMAHPKRVADLIRSLTFAPALQSEIMMRLKPLLALQPYTALHIRHTDLKSNYQELIAARKDSLAGKRVLICSDSKNALAWCEQQLSDAGASVLRTHSFASDNDAPVHRMKLSARNRYQRNLDSFLDIIALSLGEDFYSAKIPGLPRSSAYAQLIEMLRENTPLISSLLPKINNV